jgi:tRNA C32,U32 (ribose-2'-O)-methylase TrmJ
VLARDNSGVGARPFKNTVTKMLFLVEERDFLKDAARYFAKESK